MLPEYSMEGKRVLLVGAGRGIGMGIALVMAEAGADIAVTGLTPVGITRVAAKISKMGRRCIPLVADATKQDEMDSLGVKVLEEFGGLDVLVNCVGDSILGAVAPLPDRKTSVMDQAEWGRLIDINLSEAFLGCRAFGPHFLEKGKGSVINITSFAAIRPRALRSAYDAAKAGLVQFTSSLALEWAPYGVRVNAIAPGQFPDTEQLSPEEVKQRKDDASRNIPLGRFGQLREVGLLALYLASDASQYVTGQCFVIDGGLSLA